MYQHVTATMQPILLFVQGMVLAHKQILVFAILITMEQFVNIQFAMAFQLAMHLLFVPEMVIVLHQIAVLVSLALLAHSAPHQFALALLLLIQQFALPMVIALLQIHVHVHQDTLVYRALFQFVLVF